MNSGKTEVDPVNQDWTIRRMLEWTTKHLQKHGSDTPRLDAEVMLSHVMEYQRIQLYTNFDAQPTDTERAAMKDLVRRRATREPVAYLVGHREFFGLDFHVTPDVLIPRPETETLVLEAAESARALSASGESARPIEFAEVGIGSGCVTVSLAVNVPSANITGTDISPAAIEVANRNIVRHGVTDRVSVLEGSCFDPLAADATFDLIVSNPPYITDSEYETLQLEVRLHEPRVALTAGNDGLDVVRELVRDSPGRLNPGGHLMLEIDPAQAVAVEGLMRDAGLTDVRSVRDLNGQVRVVRGQLA